MPTPPQRMSSATQPDQSEQPAQTAGDRSENRDARPPKPQLLEIGWLLVGKFSPSQREAIEQTRSSVEAYLQERLPAYDWQMPSIEQQATTDGKVVEPVALLESSLIERDRNHWDFVVVISPADLKSYTRPYAFATLSRTFDAVVLSTARIDSPSTTTDVDTLAHRMAALVIHAIGHLSGLGHDTEPDNYMFGLGTTDDLDRMNCLSGEQIEIMDQDLREIADLRLEEQHRGHRRSAARFYAQSAWINRGEILESVWHARPWEIPFRLARLIIGAVSTMLVLLMTAEAWELGMSQPGSTATTLSLACVLATAGYVAWRQRLFAHRQQIALTEQVVTTQVATALILIAGMVTTYLALFLLTVVLCSSLFPADVVVNWAASLEGDIGPSNYATLAAVVASIGILIGSLGASFEGQHYFRHITYVDEEM